MSGIKDRSSSQETGKGTTPWTLLGVTLLSMLAGGALIYGLMGGPIPTNEPNSWNTPGTANYIIDSLSVNGTSWYRSFNCSSQTTVEVSSNASAVINDAIGNGTSIFVSSGTYDVTSISVSSVNNRKFYGAGNSTILKSDANVGNNSILNMTNCNGWTISDMQLDGNKANNANNAVGNIYMVNCSYNNVERIFSHDSNGGGANGGGCSIFSYGGYYNKWFYGGCFNDAHDGLHLEDYADTVVGWTAQNEGNEGIDVSGSLPNGARSGILGCYNTVSNSYAINCGLGVAGLGKGFRIYTDAHYNTFSSCTAINCTTGGLVIGRGGYLGCNYNVITGFQSYNNTIGIEILGGSNYTLITASNFNDVTYDVEISRDSHQACVGTVLSGGNQFRSSGAIQVFIRDQNDSGTVITGCSFYPTNVGFYAIDCGGSNTQIKGNFISGTNGINLEAVDDASPTNCTITGNTISCTNGIRLYTGVTGTLVTQNDFRGCINDVAVWVINDQLWGTNWDKNGVPFSYTTDTIGLSSGTGTGSSSFIEGFPIVATKTGTLQSIGINTVVANGNLRLAIYSTLSGGVFSGLVGQSASTAAVAGWNDLAATGSVVTGHTYYICFQLSTGGYSVHATSSGQRYYVSASYGAYPDPTGSLTGPDAFTPNMRMTYLAGS